MAKLTKQKQTGAEVSALLLPDMQMYSVAEGEAMGRVKDVIIDPEEKRLLALAVERSGWYRQVRVIPAGKISTVGDDLIMVDEKQAAVAPNLPKIVENMKNPCNIIGARVITQDGRALGRVEDFYLSRAGGDELGRIMRLEISCGVMSRLWAGRSSLDAEHILTLGAEAVVVDAAAVDDMQQQAGVLRANLEAVAGAAGQGARNMGGLTRRTQQRLRDIAAARKNQDAGEIVG